MPWPTTGATQHHAQLGLPDKGRAIKGLVVCNSWDLEPWDLVTGLALGCYQLFPEVGMYTNKVLLLKCMHTPLMITTLTSIYYSIFLTSL